MPYQSFSLKYRPQVFEEIIGQQHVSQTLMNALATGRVSHAYLFAGPRGTGKTTTARVLAKALNCLSADAPTPHPCGVCDMCVAIQQGNALDVKEMDAASNRGIDDVRRLRETVGYSPAQGRYKVYILDEAHQVTPDAFNALLKTLEEPPAHTVFVLATTEAHKVPATIQSRCQRFDFRTIALRDMTDLLRRIAENEGLQVEDAALGAIAQAAQGAMRDAESILDQVVAFAEGPITLASVNSVLGVTPAELMTQAVQAMVAGDLPAAFALVDELVSGGSDLEQFLVDLTGYMRDLLRFASGAHPPRWLELSDEELRQSKEQARALGQARIAQIIQELAAAREQMKETSQQVLLLEVTLAEVCAGPPPAATAPPPAPAPPAARTAVATTPTAAPPVATPPITVPPAPEEQPPPATPAATPPPAGPLTLELITQRWPLVMDELRRMGHVSVGAFVREAQPTGFDGTSLTIIYDKKWEFHYNRLTERREYREAVERALEGLLGQPVKLKCRLGELPPAATAQESLLPPTESPPAVPEPASADPGPPAGTLAEQVLNMFPGSMELADED